jgi:sulfur carrier protein
MRIVLNGEERDVRDGLTLAQLLEELRFDPSRIAVEVNRQIVPRRQHAALQLHNDDRLEVVTFVGGG